MVGDLMLARYLRRILNQPLTLHLFTASGGTEASIEEVQGGGYRPAPYAPADWNITPGSPALAEGTVREFRFDGTARQRIIGAFLTEADGGIIWVKEFEQGPIGVGRMGDIIPVRPILRMGAIS